MDVIFIDNHVLAVNKPHRLPSASDASGDPTLLDWVRSYNQSLQRPGTSGYVAPIHFLDRPVSGVVVYARSRKAATRLGAQFRERRVGKTYLAVVDAAVEPELERHLKHALLKDRQRNIVSVVADDHPEAVSAELAVRCLATDGQRSLLIVRPRSGRSHQIRVQLASQGWPIVGDLRYGAPTAWDHCIALHAAQLSLRHPVGGRPLSLTSEPDPERWDALFRTLHRREQLFEALTRAPGDAP